jgi:septal ring factor EnvC (AmiA/AmiB activator)
LALVRFSDPAPADIASLQQRIEAARQSARSLASDLQAKQSAMSAVAGRAAVAEEHEARLRAALARGRDEADRLARRTDLARRALATARKRLSRSRRLLAKRLVDIYKSDTPDLTSVILQSDGFDDLVTRVRYWEEINRADSRLAARLRAVHVEVTGRVVAVRRARDRWRAHNREVASAREQIAAVAARARAEQARLSRARGARAKALAALRGRISGWVSEVARLRRIEYAQARGVVGRWLGDFAIPLSIVMCESGGNYRAVNPHSGAGGAYQILPSTWRSYGGKGRPQDASREEQDRIAREVWARQGSGAWVCAG